MAVKTYNPKDVVVVVGGAPLSGFADGEFINIERLNDSFTDYSGSDGETARSQSNDKRGTMTLTLMQTSLSNDVLSTLAKLDERTGEGAVPIIVKDIRGTSVWFSGTGWVVKPPPGTFGKEVLTRAWVFRLAEMDTFIGGISV